MVCWALFLNGVVTTCIQPYEQVEAWTPLLPRPPPQSTPRHWLTPSQYLLCFCFFFFFDIYSTSSAAAFSAAASSCSDASWAVQAVHDKVMENSVLLKELWEGRRHHQELTLTLQRERHQTKALQLEYDQFRHQVELPSSPPLPSCPCTPPLLANPKPPMHCMACMTD